MESGSIVEKDFIKNVYPALLKLFIQMEIIRFNFVQLIITKKIPILIQNMIISKYSPNLEFPRKKYVLKSISQLLQAKTVDPPQLTLSLRMFSKSQEVLNQQQPKVMSSRIKKRSTSGINFQHYRTKSSFKTRFNFISEKEKKQKQFQQKIKLTNRDQNVNLLRKNNLANYKSTGSLPQKLFSNQALATSYSTSKKRTIINLQINQNKVQNQYIKRSQSLNKQYMKSKSSIFSCQKQENRRFLKKGSSVHKQIVTNLLRNKLLRANQQIDNPQDLQKYNSKQAIIQMIKLYKGGHMKLENVLKHKQKQKQKESTSTPLKNSRVQKLINGWEYKNDQTYIKQIQRQKDLSVLNLQQS